MQAPVFIISTGRCGSTAIARVLSSHPEVLVISELFEPMRQESYFDNSVWLTGEEFYALLTKKCHPDRIKVWRTNPNPELLNLPSNDDAVSLLSSYTLPSMTNDVDYLLNALKNKFCNEGGFQTRKTAPSLLLHFFEILKLMQKKQYWVERTGGSSAHAHEMVRCFPNAKFIHVVRDPLECASSMSKHAIFPLFLKHYGAALESEYGINKKGDITAYLALWAYWELRAFHAFGALSEGQLMRVRYDELTKRPENVFLDLLNFVRNTKISSKADHVWLSQVVHKQRDVKTTQRPSRVKLPDRLDSDLQFLRKHYGL